MQEDGRFKMNPPLRSPADREALLEGIADGTIDMIATDHAPHAAEEKSRGLEHSAMGIVGIETAFPLLYTYLVCEGHNKHGAAARAAAYCALPPLRHRHGRRFYRVRPRHGVYGRPESFISKGHSTPFAGRSVKGRCLCTVSGGRTAYLDEGFSELLGNVRAQ